MSSMQQIPSVDPGLSFQGDNGSFLCPMQKDSGFTCIGFEETKNQPSKFFVENLGNGRVRLRDHGMAYLGRTERNGKNPIEVKQMTPDKSCEFKAFTRNGKVIFQADNGLFLSRFYSGLYSGENTLEAVKKDADVHCEFLPQVSLKI